MSFWATFSRCEEGGKEGATKGEVFFVGERGNRLLRMGYMYMQKITRGRYDLCAST